MGESVRERVSPEGDWLFGSGAVWEICYSEAQFYREESVLLGQQQIPHRQRTPVRNDKM
jgi:hypothetical protein